MLRRQQDFIAYADKLKDLLASSELPEKDDLSSLKEQIQKTELAVPVIGPFSAGKSALINAMLGGSKVLPEGMTPETELATELHYAAEPYLLAVREDTTEERFSVDDLPEVNRRSSEFLFLRLYLDNPILKALSPLFLVDMPGFGSSLENHNKAISFYMPRGVHFIVVVSIDEGTVRKSMLRQLEKIRDYGSEFTFLLSKANLRGLEDVEKVRAYIQEQLADFGLSQPVTAVGKDGQPLEKALRALDPEAIFTDMFLDLLRERNIGVIEQINLALHTLRQDAEQQKATLEALERALRDLQDQRDKAVSKTKEEFSPIALENCLNNAGRALQSALDEFVALALNKDPALQGAITDVLRSSLTSSIQSEMNSISGEFLRKISQRMSSTYGDLMTLDGKNWGEELGERVNSTLHAATKVLGNWKTTLDKTAADTSTIFYKTVTAILAVTTNVLTPIIELIIIFLPDIIRLFTQDNEREKIRQKFLNEGFPNIKFELRRELPRFLDQELQNLLTAINQEFEAQIISQQKIITAESEKYAADAEENTRRTTALEELRTAVQQLATQYLYPMEA